MANLKKGEQKMEVNKTLEEQDLLFNRKMIAYKLRKQNADINLISQVTGLTFDEIYVAIKEIDPDYYEFLEREKHDSANPLGAFQCLYDSDNKQKVR